MNQQLLLQQLKKWFLLHFILGIIFALPLLFIPEIILPLFGWASFDPIMPRLVGAALFGIGTKSLLTKNDNVSVYRAMLDLKILWASAAIVAITIGLFKSAPIASVVFLVIFVLFWFLWVYYRILVSRVELE
ncbi:MAG: hypothetical protein ACPGTS_00915 [Minisyncoccia bacterium]